MKKTSRITEAILETADDLFEGGLFSEKEHEKITKRHLKNKKLPKIDSMTKKEIKALRDEVI